METPTVGPRGSDVAETDVQLRDALLITLTFAAGIVDAVSYLGLGQIFTANMTGNVVFLALAIGEGSLLTALRSMGALVGFSVGAMVAGRILLRPRPSATWPTQVTRLLAIELACLAAFAVLWGVTGGEPAAAPLYVLIGLSAVGMGFQNAAARHLAVPGFTTTVVTTALTGFMVDLPALGISGSTQRRGGWAVVSIFAGAAVGAGLMIHARAWAPVLSAGAVLLVVVLAIRYFPRSPPPS